MGFLNIFISQQSRTDICIEILHSSYINQLNIDSVGPDVADVDGTDVADGVDGMHLLHGVPQLLLILLLLGRVLLSFAAHLALALGDVR